MLCGSPNDTPPDALSLRKLPPKKPPRKPLMDFKKKEKPKKKAKHPPKEKKEEKAPTPVKVEQQIIRIEVPAPPKPKPHSAVIETQTDEMTPPKVKKRRATPPPVDLPSPPPSVEQLEEMIEAEATPPVERTLSSFLSSLSPEQLRLLLKRLRAWRGQNAATSTTELSGDKEEVKERTLSSFLLSLTPEELTELLDRLRERGQDAATSIAGLVSDTEMVKDRTLSSFLLSLSPEQLRELLKRLREGAWRRQDAATSITGLDHGATANRDLASFLLSLSPEQLRELLKRLRGDVEERQDAATSISGLISQGDLAAIDRTLSSFLLSLSTEQLRELLKRLQEDAWRRHDTATSITELLKHGDMNYQKSDRDIDIASFLLSLPLEKLRELVKRLRQDVEEDEEAATPISRIFSPGDTSDEERFKDRRLSRFLSSLSPEQLRELLARLREAGGRMSSLLFSVTEEQLKDMLAYLQKSFEDGHGHITDEEANKYRIFSSILSSLSAEQQKELLSQLREADIDIPSLISSLTGDQLKAILQYLLKTIRDGHSNIVDEDSEKYRRLSRFLSSLSSEQQKELLARLQEANIDISSLMSSLTLDQLRKILKYFREMFGDGLWNIEYEDSKKDRRLSRFLSSLSPEQQRDLLARLREADGRMSSLLFSLTSEQLKEMLGYLQTTFGEGYGDINEDEAEKHLVFSSFLSSLSEEQQRELRIHLGKANIDIPSLLSALTIDQLKKMMKELQEFFGYGNGDAGGRTDRRFSTFLSSLSPEQQRELLGSLREADGDISSLIFSLTPQKLKEILEYFKETFEDGHGDIDDDKPKKFRMLSSFLSSLSPDQRRQLLAQLRQANVDILSLISLLAAEQLEEVIEYLRGYYFEDESQDGSESGQSSPLLSFLSLEQQEGGLGYPQGAAGEGQSRVTTSGRETPSLFTPLSMDQISDLREFLQELFSVDHHAVPPNSKLSSLYYDSGMKSSEPQTPKSGTSFLFNDSDIGRKDESTSTSRVTFLVDEIERRSKEVTASISELPISQDNSVMRGQAESSTAEQTPLFNDEKIIQAAAFTSARSFLPRESSTTNQKARGSVRRQTSTSSHETLKPKTRQQQAVEITVSNNAPVRIKYDSMSTGVILVPVPSGQKPNTRPGACEDLLKKLTDCACQTSAPHPSSNGACSSYATSLACGRSTAPYSQSMCSRFSCRYSRPMSRYNCGSSDCQTAIPRLPHSSSRCFDPFYSRSDTIILSDYRQVLIERKPEKAPIVLSTRPFRGVYSNGEMCTTSTSISRSSRFICGRSQPTVGNLFARHESSYCQHCSSDLGTLDRVDIPSASYDIYNRHFFPRVIEERAMLFTQLSNRGYRYTSCVERSSSNSSTEEKRLKRVKQ